MQFNVGDWQEFSQNLREDVAASSKKKVKKEDSLHLDAPGAIFRLWEKITTTQEGRKQSLFARHWVHHGQKWNIVSIREGDSFRTRLSECAAAPTEQHAYKRAKKSFGVDTIFKRATERLNDPQVREKTRGIAHDILQPQEIVHKTAEEYNDIAYAIKETSWMLASGSSDLEADHALVREARQALTEIDDTLGLKKTLDRLVEWFIYKKKLEPILDRLNKGLTKISENSINLLTTTGTHPDTATLKEVASATCDLIRLFQIYSEGKDPHYKDEATLMLRSQLLDVQDVFSDFRQAVCQEFAIRPAKGEMQAALSACKDALDAVKEVASNITAAPKATRWEEPSLLQSTYELTKAVAIETLKPFGYLLGAFKSPPQEEILLSAIYQELDAFQGQLEDLLSEKLQLDVVKLEARQKILSERLLIRLENLDKEDSWKEAKLAILIGMQLTAGFFNFLNMKKPTAAENRQAPKVEIPEAVAKRIGNAESTLGRLLKERFDLVSEGRAPALDRYPEIKEYLDPFLGQKEAPTAKEISALMSRFHQDMEHKCASGDHFFDKWRNIQPEDKVQKETKNVQKAFKETFPTIQPPVDTQLAAAIQEKASARTDMLDSLLQAPAYPLDLNTYQNMLLHHTGKGTGYEGSRSEETIGFTVKVLEARIEAMEKNPLSRSIFVDSMTSNQPEKAIFTTLKKQLSFAREFLDAPDSAAALSAKIDATKVGETFVVPGGWSGPSGGHAVLLEFTKTDKGFTLRMYDKGATLAFAQPRKEESRIALLTFFEIEELPAESLKDPIFLRYFADLKKFGILEIKTEHLAKEMLALLPGRKKRVAYTVDQVQEGLEVGHCAGLMIDALFRHRAGGLTSYRRNAFEIKLRALTDFFATNKENFVTKAEYRKLLELGLEEVSKSTLSMPHELLSDEERVKVEEVMAPMRALCQEGKLYEAKKLQIERPKVDISQPIESYKAEQKGIDSAPLTPGKAATERQATNRADALELALHLPLDVASIANSMQKLVEAIKKNVEKPDSDLAFSEARTPLMAIVERLSLDKAFWQNVKPEDALTVLSLLDSTSHLLFKSIIAYSENGQMPHHVLFLFKLFTVGNVINSCLPESEKIPITGALWKNAHVWLQDKIAHNELTELGHRTMFMELKSYWESEPFSEASFFQMDRLSQSTESYNRFYTIDPLAKKMDDKTQWNGRAVNWPLLSWAEDWARQHQDTIKKAIPAIGELPHMQQALYLISEGFFEGGPRTEKKLVPLPQLLPRAYYPLLNFNKDLSALFTTLAHSHSNRLQNLQRPKLAVQHTEEQINIKLSLYDDDNSQAVMYPMYTRNGDIMVRDPGPKGDLDNVLSRNQFAKWGHFTSKNIDTVYKDEFRRRTPAHERVTFREWANSLDLSPQLRNELELCSTSSELQIAETLGFANRHPELLDQKNCRQFIAKLLLEPGLLEEHLQSGPQVAIDFSTQFNDLIARRYEIKKALGQLEIAADLLSFSAEIEAIIRKSGIALPEGYDAKKEWRNFLSQDIPQDTKSRFAADLALSYSVSDELSTQGAEDILAGFFAFDLGPLSDSHALWNMGKSALFDEMRDRIGPQLHKVVQSQDPELISRAMRRLYPELPLTQFHPTEHPDIYTDSQKSMQVNIATGHIYFEDGHPRKLPAGVQKVLGSEFKHLASTLWREIAPNQYQIDLDGEMLTIFKGSYDIEQYQWKRGDTTYYSIGNVLPIPESIQKDTRCWLSTKEGKEGYREALLTSNKDFRCKFRIDIRAKPSDKKESYLDASLVKVRKLDAMGHDTNLILAKGSGSLKPFERIGTVTAWIDEKSQKLQDIEIPDLGLTFSAKEVDGERRAYSNAHPGWYVPVDKETSSNQYIESLGNNQYYLVLQKDMGSGVIQRRALLPVIASEPREEPLKKPLMRSQHPDDVHPLKSYGPYVLCSVDAKTGELEPQNMQARAYLAEFYLRQRDYARANGLLAPLSPLTGQIGSELTILFKPKDGDQSPAARAFRMNLAHIYLQNKFDFGGLGPEETAKIYLSYLQKLPEMGIHAVSKECELLALRELEHELDPDTKLPHVRAIFLDRLKEIDPERYAALGYTEDLPPVVTATPPLPERWDKASSGPEREEKVYIGPPTEKGFAEKQSTSLPRYDIRTDFADFLMAITEDDTQQLQGAISFLTGKFFSKKGRTTADLKGELKQHLAQLVRLGGKKGTAAAWLVIAIERPDLQWPKRDDWHNQLHPMMSKIISNQMINPPPQSFWPPILFNLARELEPLSDQTVEVIVADTPSSLPVLGEDAIVRRPKPDDIEFAKSLLLDSDAFELHKPLVANLDEALGVRAATAEEQKTFKSSLAGLEKALRVQTGDPYFQKALGEGADKVRDYGARCAVQSQVFVKDKSTLEGIANRLIGVSGALYAEADKKQKEVVAFANKPAQDAILNADLSLGLTAVTQAPASFQELASFLITCDMARVHKRLPYLKEEDIPQLFARTIDALKASRLAALADFQAARAEDLLSALAANAPQVEIHRLGKQLLDANSYQPPYLSQEKPALLIYDQFMGFRVRQDQVDLLELLPKRVKDSLSTHQKGVLQEAIMGFGKTEVISVLLALQEADGEKLIIMSMPEQLLPSVSRKLKVLLGGAFDTTVEVFEFDRDSNVSAQSLRRILDRFSEIRTDKRVMIASSSSLLSLVLRFVELALDVDSSKEQLDLMAEIITTLKSNGYASLDEVDVLFDILKAHLFTMGDATTTHKDLRTTITGLFSAIMSDRSLQNIIRWPFIKSSSELPFTEETYNVQAKPKLIEAVLGGKILPENDAFRKFLQGLDSTQKAAVASYLNAKPSRPDALIALFSRLDAKQQKEVAAYIAGDSDIAKEINLPVGDKKIVDDYMREKGDPAVAFVSQIQDPHIKNILATLKDQISEIIPLTQTKVLGEQYGRLPKEMQGKMKLSARAAIPYEMGNPKPHSSHGTVSEILDYTTLAHMQEPIDRDILSDEIRRLKAILDKEVAFLDSVEESKALQGFWRLNGNDRSMLLKAEMTEDEMQKIERYVNSHPEVKLELIDRHVLPTIQHFQIQLGAASQLLATLVHSVKGITGTSWNEKTYPPNSFHTSKGSDTEVHTLQLLWQNSPHTVQTIPEAIDKLSVNEKITHLYQNSPFKESLADVGGWFRNDPPEQVAHAIGMQLVGSQYRGVLYHDAQGQEMVMPVGGGAPITPSQAGLKPDELAAYWARRYCTGVDFKLNPFMTATVIVSKQTIMRDALQTVWRLRQLADRQKVAFAIREEDRKIIEGELKVMLGITAKNPLSLDDLFLYALSIEKRRLKEDTPKAFREALKAHLIDKVLDAVAIARGDDLRQLMDDVKALFVSIEADDPWTMMGKTQGVAPRAVVMAQELVSLFNSAPFQAFKNNPHLKQVIGVDQLKTELRAIADGFVKDLPDVMKQSGGQEREKMVEVDVKRMKEAEKETDKERQREKELEKEIQKMDAKYTVARDELKFSPDTLFTSGCWQPSSALFTAYTLPLGGNKVVTLNGAITQAKSSSAAVFDEKLLVDLNFAPIYWRSSMHMPPYSPWGLYEDSLTDILVVQQANDIKVVLIDQATAKELKKSLKKERKTPSKNAEVTLALYNLDSKVVQEGSRTIPNLDQNESFIRLSAQAKFYAGRINYTKDELKHLESWFSEKDVNEMEELFTKTILTNKDYMRRLYVGSDIDRLFQRLLKADV